MSAATSRRQIAALGAACALALTGTAAAQAPSPPSARPPLEKRKFTSEAVERKITEVTKTIADPEVARIFEACYPNTLDTTVNFEPKTGKPDTLHHHRRHQRDVAARLGGPGAGLPPAVQGGCASRPDARGIDPSAGRIHPDRSIRERLPEGRVETQPAPQGRHGDAARRVRAQMGGRFPVLPDPSGAISTGKSRATRRPSTSNGRMRCAWCWRRSAISSA